MRPAAVRVHRWVTCALQGRLCHPCVVVVRNVWVSYAFKYMKQLKRMRRSVMDRSGPEKNLFRGSCYLMPFLWRSRARSGALRRSTPTVPQSCCLGCARACCLQSGRITAAHSKETPTAAGTWAAPIPMRQHRMQPGHGQCSLHHQRTHNTRSSSSSCAVRDRSLCHRAPEAPSQSRRCAAAHAHAGTWAGGEGGIGKVGWQCRTCTCTAAP